MTKTEQLLELAARCEAATGPDRELDCLIQEWRFPELNPSMRVMYYGEPTGEHVRDEGETYVRAPAYTASLDAAMTLVPEGWRCWALREDDSGWWCGLKFGNSDRVEGGWVPAKSHALALSAAALRAQAQESDHAE